MPLITQINLGFVESDVCFSVLARFLYSFLLFVIQFQMNEARAHREKNSEELRIACIANLGPTSDERGFARGRAEGSKEGSGDSMKPGHTGRIEVRHLHYQPWTHKGWRRVRQQQRQAR